jgi:hypothetical protein
LTRAKDLLKALKLTKETAGAVKDAYEAFDLGDLTEGMF